MTLFSAEAGGGNRVWNPFSNLWMVLMIAPLDIHTIPSTVYPPMSHWV